MAIGKSRGGGNPWGSGVKVYKGKGGGMNFQTPDPSRHPWAKNPYIIQFNTKKSENHHVIIVIYYII